MSFVDWFCNLPWDAVKITCGIITLMFFKPAIKGAVILAEHGHKWVFPFLVFSLFWGVFMIVYNTMEFIRGLL